jgi:hypothetical protein
MLDMIAAGSTRSVAGSTSEASCGGKVGSVLDVGARFEPSDKSARPTSGIRLAIPTSPAGAAASSAIAATDPWPAHEYDKVRPGRISDYGKCSQSCKLKTDRLPTEITPCGAILAPVTLTTGGTYDENVARPSPDEDFDGKSCPAAVIGMS